MSLAEIILTSMIFVTMFYCEGLNKRIKKLEDQINGLNRGNTDIFSHETIENEEDADTVQHGHWIDHTSEVFPADSTIECSVCHEHESASLAHDNYCPNCGIKMDGKEDE